MYISGFGIRTSTISTSMSCIKNALHCWTIHISPKQTAHPKMSSADTGCMMKFALCCWKEMLPEMARLRAAADAMEAITDKTFWPYPSYGEILFSVY